MGGQKDTVTKAWELRHLLGKMVLSSSSHLPETEKGLHRVKSIHKHLRSWNPCWTSSLPGSHNRESRLLQLDLFVLRTIDVNGFPWWYPRYWDLEDDGDKKQAIHLSLSCHGFLTPHPSQKHVVPAFPEQQPGFADATSRSVPAAPSGRADICQTCRWKPSTLQQGDRSVKIYNMCWAKNMF